MEGVGRVRDHEVHRRLGKRGQDFAAIAVIQTEVVVLVVRVHIGSRSRSL